MSQIATTYAALPPDDLGRALAFVQLDSPTAQHIGLVGNTYTITVAGKDTDGRFCVIDMHVPPGGGPGPHRHDFEETFILLEGELEMTFRGAKSIVRVGDTVNVPSNAPHQFHNSSSSAVRMICICAPAGNEKYFLELGVPVATRTTPPPKLDEKQMAEFAKKARAIAPKYGTELLDRALRTDANWVRYPGFGLGNASAMKSGRTRTCQCAHSPLWAHSSVFPVAGYPEDGLQRRFHWGKTPIGVESLDYTHRENAQG